jgi:ubiquinone/menaquinone biosynthesis C-methylase UbiE
MAVGKPYRGLGMEGCVATWYAATTGRSRQPFVDCARAIAARLAPGSRVLEVAPGPGYLAIELAQRGFQVSGVDISRTFVRIARDNARRAGLRIDFQQGDAAHLPFADASFDFVVCRAAFKNFADPLGALNEAHRVLKPGGQASIYDLRKDASPEAIDAAVRDMHLTPLNALLTRWTFKLMLLKRAYTHAALQRLVNQSAFGTGDILPDGIGFELRLARPQS